MKNVDDQEEQEQIQNEIKLSDSNFLEKHIQLGEKGVRIKKRNKHE